MDDYYKIEEEKADYLKGGIIVIQSPASLEHERIFRDLLTQLHNYVTENNSGEVLGSRFTIALGRDFRFEPDIVFISKGNKGILSEYEFSGTPDLIIEIISKTSRSYDLQTKRDIYKQYKVQEIYFVDYLEREVFIDVLEGGKYSSSTVKFGVSVRSKLLRGLDIVIK
ncbi:Uma2 family endonuclease [Candidatus Kuenenia stuttgartensis]|uniref:Uma2 family endonuclease n=1 Tax=Kuenenia stuttgartiensis TaxID=174633 RepID=UPI00146B8829|nr:Uma2 family endonuclease [Candidatus Kuenenia stuttgartiensis]